MSTPFSLQSKIFDAAKVFCSYALRLLLKVFWIHPVKQNKMVFVSFGGRQFSDNPKYIYKKLQKEYSGEFEYVWCANAFFPFEEIENHSGTRIVKYLSFRYFREICTCGIYITNCAVEPFIPKRKKQLFVCSWHGGGAYKKVGINQGYAWKKMSKSRADNTDVYTSACRAFKNFVAPDWYADSAKFLECGMPRNDFLISEKNNAALIENIKIRLGIPPDKKIILYAPTFRGKPHAPQKFDISLDVKKIIAALAKRFGGTFCFAFRCHHTMLGRTVPCGAVYDMSNYPDMQELLLAADVLISDYSSSIWDFSLMFKPCFLFTPDLKEYENFRDFYVPIHEWPFLYSLTNEALERQILNFDENVYKERCLSHHYDLGSFEKGNACEVVCNKIIDFTRDQGV